MAVSPLMLAAIAGGAFLLTKLGSGGPSFTPRPEPNAPKLGPPSRVKGKSGQVWDVQLVKRFEQPSGPDEIFFDVFTTNGARIVRYKQLQGRNDTRKFIVSPSTTDKSLVSKAMSDFGIKP